ncbi:MAG: AI-2E family transporter [Desulfovibrio sp.]|jgi:predicted PurR-regulated permease PerM|nr:AI-2E family transporter [Desulfovibrio sp.]
MACMNALLPRLFYISAAFALYLLLQPHPVAIFMAACFACLTLPVYRGFKPRAYAWMARLKRDRRDGRMRRFLLSTARVAPVYGYTVFVIGVVLVPVAALVLLVSPQAVAGLARLRELRENNFQIPPEWVEYIRQGRESLAQYPRLEKIVNDFFQDLDALFSDAMSLLINRGADFLGSTMTVLWTTILFFMLTVLFAVYSKQIRKIAARIFHLPQTLLRRFVVAIYRALRAIMLGILLVSLAQGFLCGMGYAVAGFKQPAFWGLLSTLTAPIPMVGTAIVWLPLCLSLWFSGKTAAAVGLGLWGLLAVSNVDSFLRPLFLRQGINAPFFVLLAAILCGLAVFGPVGLIAGPVLLTFSIQALEEGNRFYNGS